MQRAIPGIIITLVLFFLSNTGLAGVVETEWYSDKAHKVAMLSFLANNPRGENVEGPIVLYTHATAHLGYVASVKMAADIIRERFPHRQLQVLILASANHVKANNKIFSFNPTIDSQYITNASELDSHPWLENAGLIISVITPLNDLTSKIYPNILLTQLGSFSDSVVSEGWYHRIFREYRDVLPYVSEKQLGLLRESWQKETVYTKLCPGGLDLNIPIKAITDCIEEERRNSRFDNPHNQFMSKFLPNFHFSFIKMGFSPFSAGILTNPDIEKSDSAEEHSYEHLLSLLEDSNPNLAAYLQEYAEDGRFYYAYLHKTRDLAQYLATVALLEKKTPVVLVKGADAYLDPFIIGTLKKHGIEKMFLDFVAAGRVIPVPVGGTSGKTIRVAILDSIKSDKAYLELLQMAQNPIGVTGNQSLVTAIQLKKIPFYSANLQKQNEINENLKLFAPSVRLGRYFSNSLSPRKKAKILKAEAHNGIQWAENILARKSANELLNRQIELTLFPDADVEAMREKIAEAMDSDIEQFPENPILNDVVQFKRYMQHYHQKIEALDAYQQTLNADAFKRLASQYLNKMIDPDLRHWFMSFSLGMWGKEAARAIYR